MEQVLIRRLKPGTLGGYRALAKAHGRSLEAELRAVLEAGLPRPVKDVARLLDLSAAARARTIAVAKPSDSTDLIREDRDTNHGKWVTDQDGDAGH